MKTIKIAVVDDHDLFREGIKLVLNQIQNFELIFETSNGYEFLEFLNENEFDIVLMDIEMPKINGIETTKEAVKIKPEIKIIALTMFSDLSHFKLMINAGIKGFILKNVDKFELQKAVNTVYGGENYFCRQILQKSAFIQIDNKSDVNLLSARETEVLQLVCKGFTSQEIADALFISIKTVEAHRTNIFQKADVRNTAELILWAIKNDLFEVK